jgi:drug/metabolite transporter (DMT)-like permease
LATPALEHQHLNTSAVRPAAGIGWMLVATLLFVSLDTTAKFLSADYPVEQVVWARFTFHFVFVLGLIAPQGLPGLRTARPGLQLLRSAFMLGANGFFFYGLRELPLVTASAVVFVGPLLVTALSVPLLGEKVGPRRWAAIAVGFGGAMVIIQPGPGMFDSAAIWPLCAAISFSFYQICTRALSRYDAPLTTLLYTAVVGMVASSIVVPAVWVAPDMNGWLLMGTAGVFGALGQLALIKAIGSAPVSTVAPFSYIGLLWATAFGFLAFGDVPALNTLIGAAIIAASGLYVLHRERAARKAETPD